MPTAGYQSLANFYRSTVFHDQRLAAIISDDVLTIAMHASREDKVVGQAAVDRLRMRVRNLPEIHRRVLESALFDLGYS